MDTPTLKVLTRLNDQLSKMARSMKGLQSAENEISYDGYVKLNLWGIYSIELNDVPNLKEKVFKLVSVEYAKEYNRLFKEYDDLAVCKPNGKVTNYTPINLAEL